MSIERNQEPGKSKEYLEQLAIEAIATSRYPDTRIKEIRPGFYTDEHNYVWLVVLEQNKPFENTLTTVDTNDILAWREQLRREQ